ncbi:hypothetical protein [Haloferula rosea]|uniref:SLA1 homology domain-containing protein n=1 Tax=Haloferula rosea TaxID=490093 RepID=A0A934RDB6_9BACT|nr:hypothetical protein [Haloferula rosea]MBK1826961.1 hypothetical protein [Haloferula rosea]
MNLKTLAALLLCIIVAHGDNLREERIWTGKNGKTFRGIFLQVTTDEKSAQIASNTGKVFTIALANLSDPDRQLILDSRPSSREPAADQPAEAGENNLDGFKNPPPMPRSTIMPTTPEAVGSRKSDELVDPFWQFIGWWDTEKVLPIPREGDFDERLEWAHERLARYCKIRTGGSVIDVEKLREGLEEYFEEHLKDKATIVVREDTDFSPARLHQYASDMNAVVLRLSMIYESGRRYRACAAVESVEPNGDAVLHLWGCRKKVRIEIDKRRPPKSMGRSLSSSMDSYKIIPENLDGLPDFVGDNEAKLYVDPKEWDTVVIAKPYLFATEGKRRTPPTDDPLFKPAVFRKAPPVNAQTAGRIELPLDFRSSTTPSRPWHFADGSSFEGKLSFDRTGEPSLRDNSGKTRPLDVSSLTEEDQATYHFAHGCSGAAATPERLELHYQLKTQHGDDYEFIITTEGSLGRVDCPQLASSLIFDLKDQAYSCIRKSRRYFGRWGGTGLVPLQRFASIDESKKHEAFTDTVRGAPASDSFRFPARSASFSVAGKTFTQPRVEFTLIKEPTAMTAIYQMLNAGPPADRNPDNPKDPTRQRSIVFSLSTEVSNHNGLREIGPRFVDHYLLPLRIHWTNLRNTSWVQEEDRLKSSGQFSLSLTSAKVPGAFPADHFRIPDEAHKAEIGTCFVAKE